MFYRECRKCLGKFKHIIVQIELEQVRLLGRLNDDESEIAGVKRIGSGEQGV